MTDFSDRNMEYKTRPGIFAEKIKSWFSTPDSLTDSHKTAYSLAFFRIVFGILMVVAEIRFISRDWITDFYVKPQFFFTFFGFDWIHPLPAPYIYWVFYGLVICGVLIALGLFYRIAIWSFFLGFTYVELLDKSVYLNHYYQVSMLAFIMCFLPMNRKYSLDAGIKAHLSSEISFLGKIFNFLTFSTIKSPLPENWMLWALRLQVGSVYFFGGVAKLKYDWLFRAQPLRIWLAANEHFPLIGSLLTQTWVAFVLSWFALFFDLTAPFLLSFRKTRFYIYLIIVIFHLLTHYLFYIGMFPWMMIFTALIFFPSDFHQKVLRFLPEPQTSGFNTVRASTVNLKWLFTFFFLFQLIMPFRSHFYEGNVLWHEQGFRFSWNIMLMEKNASLEYRVKVKKSGEEFYVRPSEFLTRIQARQCSFQPDMILQFAHYLHQYYVENGLGDTEIRAECYASLNGRGSQLLIDPNVDLTKEHEGFMPKTWITKLN